MLALGGTLPQKCLVRIFFREFASTFHQMMNYRFFLLFLFIRIDSPMSVPSVIDSAKIITTGKGVVDVRTKKSPATYGVT